MTNLNNTVILTLQTVGTAVNYHGIFITFAPDSIWQSFVFPPTQGILQIAKVNTKFNCFSLTVVEIFA